MSERVRRRKADDAFFELAREGIVNALVHRDYGIEGAKCQLAATADTITVKSPGRPLDPITLEQMKSFSAPMLSRNPVLHYVFAGMELAEERGLGLKSMKGRAEASGLPLPKYSWDAPYLVLTLYRNQQAGASDLIDAVAAKLSPDEAAALRFAVTKVFISSRDLIDKLKFDERKAQRILKKLVGRKLLKRVGKGPATKYKMIRSRS